MSGVKISALPEATVANDTDQIEVNQNGTSRSVTVGQVAVATRIVNGELTVSGVGQQTASINTAGALGGTLYVQDTTVNVANSGGMVMFGFGNGAFAAIKGLAVNASNNTLGDLVVSTRRLNTDTTLTETARFLETGGTNLAGVPTALAATAVGAGAATQAFVKASSTANLGIYYGTGAPAFSAAKGSLYSCTNATTTTTRLYVNTDGAGTWATITTSA